MYSLILMATLTTPATTLDCHKNRCSGCTGSYATCSGGCYGTCSGSRCSGSRCSGSRSSCSGCYGSCSGCYGSACSGSSCSGCYGGSAYYYTGSCYGGHSCYGCSGSSCAGCTGGGHTAAYPPSYEQTAPTIQKTSYLNNSPAPARISIALPADAKLYVDGQLTKTMDKSFRTFSTPDLENGQEYRYVMKAEVIRDGIVQSETKTVIVKAGSELREEFSTLSDIKTTASR